MSIIQNLMNTPYKRATEEFINKDTSITASYGRTHVIPSGSGLMGIVLLVAVVGYIFAMVNGGEKRLVNGYERKPRNNDRRYQGKNNGPRGGSR